MTSPSWCLGAGAIPEGGAKSNRMLDKHILSPPLILQFNVMNWKHTEKGLKFEDEKTWTTPRAVSAVAATCQSPGSPTLKHARLYGRLYLTRSLVAMRNNASFHLNKSVFVWLFIWSDHKVSSRANPRGIMSECCQNKGCFSTSFHSDVTWMHH